MELHRFMQLSSGFKGMDHFLLRCCPPPCSVASSNTLCIKSRPCRVPVYHSVVAHMFSQASCVHVRVCSDSVWEPLTFHTHLLTSLNSPRADSWVLPWPWGVEVRRAHEKATHTLSGGEGRGTSPLAHNKNQLQWHTHVQSHIFINVTTSARALGRCRRKISRCWHLDGTECSAMLIFSKLLAAVACI